MNVNVSGVIVQKDKKVSKDGRYFKLRCPNMNQTFTLIYNDIQHSNLIRKGDSIFARCMYENNLLIVVSPPLVLPPEDKGSIIECFRLWRFKNTNAAKDFYESLSYWVLSDSESNKSETTRMIEYLDDRSQSWNDFHNLRTLDGPICNHDALKDILTSWHKERNIRKLRLLSLSYTDIENCSLPATEIYNLCLINPHRLSLISESKCSRILTMINRQISDDEIYKSQISRYIDSLIIRQGWSSVPGKFVLQKFPNISEYYQALCDNYGLHYEYTTFYSRLTHAVELYVSKYIANKVQVESKSDVVIASWENDKLSEDQKYSVQLALNNKFSIINGGAGCGKCLHPMTEVLLLSGKLVRAKDIVVGDILMSPDSSGQMVTSTCSGIDQMYRIYSENGEEFICNSVHVLTLIGKPPYVNNNIAYVTKRGIPIEVKFSSHCEALQYISNYELDIYDIPLNEFLASSYQNNSYLISTGVNFPFTRVSPYQYDPNGISEEYLRNSRAIRLSVLLTLMKNGKLEYKTERMKDDIIYLCRSLGYIVFNDKSDNNLVIENNRPLKFTVEKIGEGNYNGFTLDGDGRFVLGNFIITHNTTCIREIVENLKNKESKYALCAFTGKAVSRLREVTGQRDAFTIHRLIHNASKELVHYNHIIVDEASMLTTELFYKFIRIYSDVSNITLVGDTNQLQPIGWGMLFNSILKSETVPTCTLSTNYRVYTSNGERDGIILNANLIACHDNENPFEFEFTQNFSVISASLQGVYDILAGCKNGGIKSSQIVVLSPFNEYLDTLNSKFQEIFTPGDDNSVIESRGKKWIVGDRVMLIENDEETGIFNGETGIIDSIEPNTESGEVDRIKVIFGGMYYDFMLDPTSSRSIDKLKHAYALSIDKSQGSEWDFVIIAIPKIPTSKFINKNRMYTAITRTKRCCWIITEDIEALQDVVVRSPPYRCDNLSKRLTEILPNIKPYINITSTTSAMDTILSTNDDFEGYEFDDAIDCDDY